jgi:hypothetical protein
MIVAYCLQILVGSEEKKDVKEIAYFIMPEKGAIGCLSKDAYQEARDYYVKGNFAAAQKLLDDQVCFFFKKGTKLYAPEDTCLKSDKNDALFPFKPNDFMLLQPYLPCEAVR